MWHAQLADFSKFTLKDNKIKATKHFSDKCRKVLPKNVFEVVNTRIHFTRYDFGRMVLPYFAFEGNSYTLVMHTAPKVCTVVEITYLKSY